MSNAVVCDRCGSVCAEDKATRIEVEWMSIEWHYDLCPACRKEYWDFMHPVKKDEADDGKGD